MRTLRLDLRASMHVLLVQLYLKTKSISSRTHDLYDVYNLYDLFPPHDLDL